MPQLLLPSQLNDIRGIKLGNKLQEFAAWKAWVDQEIGIARAVYSIIAVQKRLNPRDKDLIEAYGFCQAYMKRLESYGDGLKTMYDALSRQVAIRDVRLRSEGSGKYT